MKLVEYIKKKNPKAEKVRDKIKKEHETTNKETQRASSSPFWVILINLGTKQEHLRARAQFLRQEGGSGEQEEGRGL